MRILYYFSLFIIITAITAPAQSAELVYQADFEDGFKSEGLKIKKELLNGGEIDIVDNPLQGGLNTSAKVVRCRVPNTLPDQLKTRAEISSERSETNEKTYTYKFSYYIPCDFFKKGNFDWLIISQWKTYPCGYHDGYSDTICESCGIFNDVHLAAGNEIEFRYRAKPDCKTFKTLAPFNEWVDFTVQVYWTQTSKGWSKIFQNGEEVFSVENIRTLFTSFKDACNMYWAIGIYCYNKGETATIYVDNLEIYDGVLDLNKQE